MTARLPRVDLTEVLLEVRAWTNFTTEFRHVSEGDARVGDLDLSLCAVLLAEACNIGPGAFGPPRCPGVDPRPALLGAAELHPRRDPDQGQRPAGRLPGPAPLGSRSWGGWRGGLGRRHAV